MSARPDGASIRAEGGRAAERTALSWSRSALAMAGTGALITKAGAEGGSLTVGLLGGGVILGAALAVWAYSVALSRRAREDRAVPSGARANLGITVASVGTGVLALLVVLLG